MSASPLKMEETYNIYVTKFIEPEIVDCRCSSHEVPLLQMGVDLRRCYVKLMENPPFHKTFIPDRLKRRSKG